MKQALSSLHDDGGKTQNSWTFTVAFFQRNYKHIGYRLPITC